MPNKHITTVIQGIIDKHTTGTLPTFQINYLSRKIESLKEHIRNEKYVLSLYGRELSLSQGQSTTYTKEKYETQKQKVTELEALKNKAISIRSSYGVAPPPEPKSLPQQTYQAQKMFVDGEEVKGVVYDVQGNIKEVIPLSTPPVHQQLKPYEVQGQLVMVKGYSQAKQKSIPKDVAEAGSFIDVINQGTQILVAEETDKAYKIYANPNIDLTESQTEIIERNLLSRGFVEVGGAYVYEKHKKEYSVNPQQEFSLGDPFIKKQKYTKIKGAIIDPYDVPVNSETTQEFKKYIESTPEFQKSHYQEIAFFSQDLSLTRKFYYTDYAAEFAKPIKEVTPFLGAVAEFGGEIVEDLVVKPIASIGTIGRAVYEIQTRRGAGTLTDLQWAEQAGNAYAAIPSFINLPSTAMLLYPATVSSGTTVKTVGKTSTSRLKLLSQNFENGQLIREYNLFTNTPYNIGTLEKASVKFIVPVSNVVSKAVASTPAQIAKETVKGAVIFGGIQTGIEIIPQVAKAYSDYPKSKEFRQAELTRKWTVPQAESDHAPENILLNKDIQRISYSVNTGVSKVTSNPEAVTRIRGAAALGAVLYGGGKTFEAAKPFFDAKKGQYKTAVANYVTGPGKVVTGTVDVALETYQHGKTFYFLAGGSSIALSRIQPDNPIYAHAKITQFGLNPFSQIKSKPKVIEKSAPQQLTFEQMVDKTRTFPIAQKSVAVQSFKFREPAKQKKDVVIVSPVVSEFFQSSGVSERVADLEREITGAIQREDAIQRLKQGQKFKYGPLEREKVSERQKEIVFVLPKLKIGVGVHEVVVPRERTRQKFRETTTTKTKIPIPLQVPGLHANKEIRSLTPKKSTQKVKRQYAPSIIGEAFNLEASNTTGVQFIGAIRGVQKKKKKRGKK